MTSLKSLVGTAFRHAVARDMQSAGAALQRIGDEHGGEAVEWALRVFCDVTLNHIGHPEGQPVRLEFRAEEGGPVTDADGVGIPEVVWAGRMFAARAASDVDAWGALINALPDDKDVVGRHCGALLEVAAATYRNGGCRS